MKQREHTRVINDRAVVVNRGHNPHRFQPPAGHNGAAMKAGLADLGSDGKPVLRKADKVSTLRDAWCSAMYQFGGRSRFPQKDGTAFLVNGLYKTLRVGPYTHFDSYETLNHIPCNDVDVTGSLFEGDSVHFPEFKNSILDDTVFVRQGFADQVGTGQVPPQQTSPLTLASPNFGGASLRNSVFHHVVFSGISDLRDTDLEGADFSNAWATGVVDVRGSNISGEQFNTLVQNSSARSHGFAGDTPTFKFDYVTSDELINDYGMDKEELTVLLWTGALDALHPNGQKLENPEDFDPSLHVIPIWDAEQFMNSET